MFFILPWKLKQTGVQPSIPTANIALIAINVLIWLFGGFWVVGRGMGVMSILTYGFCHFGFWHLAVNMWTLWVFGNPVNRRLGNTLYLLAYVGTIVALGLFAWLLLPVQLVGSSGAVFAVIAMALILMPGSVLDIACLIWFPLTVVVGLFSKPTNPVHWLLRWAKFSVPALWCLLLIPLMEILSLVRHGIVAGWSWSPVAHLLGMLCGVAVVLMLPTRISMGRRSATSSF